jgi:large subunit ribosomal protein L35
MTKAEISQNTSCFVVGKDPILCALFRRKADHFMRRPKGVKTKKAAAKRFKITAKGKVLRLSAGRRHLMQTKSPKRRRKLRGSTSVHPTDEYRIKQSLPFTR